MTDKRIWSQENLLVEVDRVAKSLGIPPERMSLSEFLSCVEGIITKHAFDKFGGYRCFVASNFTSGVKDLKVIQGQNNHIAYVKRLERTVGERESFREKLLQDVSKIIAAQKEQTNFLDKWETKRFLKSFGKASGSPRSVVTLWSDHHFGTSVGSEEVSGKNKFNWEIGARRLGKLVEQVATYKLEKRSLHEELDILLDGDSIGGFIHNQEGPDYDLMVFQLCGTISYYKQAINFLKQFFPKIRVFCQPGNHGRVVHKGSHDRALHQKYDSFENVIFYSLSSCFSEEKNIEFNVSRAPFSDIRIQGHRVYMTHGDTVFHLGNVSNNVRISSLELQVNRINADELRLGKEAYSLFCLGHVHHPMVTELSSGSRIAINGNLIGLEPYTLGIGIHSSSPSQLIWEATDKFVQGDVRIVNVSDADNEKRYDTIISPYNYELKEKV